MKINSIYYFSRKNLIRNLIQPKIFYRLYSNISQENINILKNEIIPAHLNWEICLIDASYLQRFYDNFYTKIKKDANWETYLNDLKFLSAPKKIITIINYIDQYDKNIHLIAVYFEITEEKKNEFLERGFDISKFKIRSNKEIKQTYLYPCTLNYNDNYLEHLNLNKMDPNHINILKISLKDNLKPQIGLFLTVDNNFIKGILYYIEDYFKNKHRMDVKMLQNKKKVILTLYNKLLNNQIKKEGIEFDKQKIIRNGLLIDFYLNNYSIYYE